MITLREAAQRALEAWSQPNGINYVDFRPYMEALRAALGQPEQEPVVGPSTAQLDQIIDGLTRCHVRASSREFLRVWIRDWTAHKLSTHPPRREWRGLTDEEFWPMWEAEAHMDRKGGELVAAFARAIEQALKERNA